jgi:NTE family protein
MLEASAERKNDLLFGNQTYLRLKSQIALRRSRRHVARDASGQRDEIFLLSYRSESRN